MTPVKPVIFLLWPKGSDASGDARRRLGPPIKRPKAPARSGSIGVPEEGRFGRREAWELRWLLGWRTAARTSKGVLPMVHLELKEEEEEAWNACVVPFRGRTALERHPQL